MGLEIILEKAAHFEKAIEDRHMMGGLVLPTLVLPPYGQQDMQTGNYENCGVWTSVYVAAQALKFAVTADIGARAKAWSGILALNRLQDVTGQPGLVARGYKLRDGPSWDEDFFWKKGATDSTRHKDEWHQNGDYRWLGGTSKSQILGMMFGYFSFAHLCNPTSEEGELMGRNVVQIVQRILDNDRKIVDEDGNAKGWGDYNRYGVGPALLLSHIRLAQEITGDDRFGAEYEKQFEITIKKGLLSIHTLSFWPVNRWHTTFGSDYNNMMLNYYMLMNLEQNSEILEVYNTGLERLWKKIGDPENSMFNLIYHCLTGPSQDLQQGIEALGNFQLNKTVDVVALKREISLMMGLRDIKGHGKMALHERPVDEYAWRVNPFRHDRWISDRAGKMEFTGVDFLIAAYLGIYHGFIK